MDTIHSDIKKQLLSFVKTNKIPNIIFHGESGCGKNMLLNYLLKNIYRDTKNINDYVMNVNCSFGKGIKFIRDELKFFAKMNFNQKTCLIKSVILLNADKLTIDAQSALRRCIELFSKNTRFFIIVENKDSLLKPIISRFSDIFVPYPQVNNKIVNLNKINKHTFIHLTKINKNKITHIFNNIDTYTVDKLLNISVVLYDQGISGIYLIYYLDNYMNDSYEKYNLLLYLYKIKNHIRNEKILIFQILNMYKMRFTLDLENIDRM